MNFSTYKLMCKKFFKINHEYADFAHLYLILEWNLMARSDNIKDLNIKQIEWRNDLLVFSLQKEKEIKKEKVVIHLGMFILILMILTYALFYHYQNIFFQIQILLLQAEDYFQEMSNIQGL